MAVALPLRVEHGGLVRDAHVGDTISYLDQKEIKALLRAPDRNSWLGRRDHALLLVAIQTGVRVSELVALRIGDISLDTGAHCRVLGKGRKERCATLTSETIAVLHTWLDERQGLPEQPLSQAAAVDR